jgi:hypothetical protein
LEHQDKPREFLNVVKELLKDGGYIAGSVPNRDSYFWQELNQKIFIGDYPPNHFLRFSDIALKNCLEITGFNSLKIYKLDFSFKELPSFVEKKIFGNIDSIKIKIKAKILGKDENLAKVISIEDLNKYSEDKLILSFLKILKLTKDIALLPFTVIYLNKLKSNGLHLFFVGKA